MMINNSFKNKFGFRIPILTLILGLSIVGLTISCEKEDDLPPPSAYVPPEPDENCPDGPVATDIYSGIEFACEIIEFTVFGDNEGANPYTATVIDNPDQSGINTSPKVVEVKQSAGVQGWAGMFFDLDAKIDFNENQGFKIKVWSPAAGQVVNVKLEDKASEGGIAKEVATTTTVANEWEELTVNFTTEDSDKFDRIVLFFNFNGDKDAETTHYFDGITLGEPAEVVIPDDPTVGAPDPTIDAAEVISLFSDVYTDVLVDTWRTDWSNADYEEVLVADNPTKKYSNLTFVGIEATTEPIDATGMTHFSTDVWTGDATGINIKLVDFGADGAFGGGDDVEHEVAIGDLVQGEWNTIDIPLSQFTGLVTRGHIAQLIFVAVPGGNTVYVDNVFFYNEAGVTTEPQSAAPAPTRDAANVIAIYSDAYTPITVTELPTEWSGSGFEEVQVEGDNVIKYFNLDFTGIVTDYANPTDLSGMTHVHFDYWTADAEALGLKLVNTTTDPVQDPMVDLGAITKGQWVSVDIPLSDFDFDRSAVTQILFDNLVPGDASITVFIDNLYFYADITEPQSAAPTPTQDAADVISMFSDAYDDVVVDTWRTDWSEADFEDVTIDGNAVKKYSNLGFVGIETVANQLDVTDKTHFRVDIWTADATEIKIKLVDFGADGAYDGGDDVEHELTFASPAQGEWVSFDIPLSDFTGLTTKANIAQLIFVGAPWKANTIYVDNVYFY